MAGTAWKKSEPSSTVTHASMPTLGPEDAVNAVSDTGPAEHVGIAGSTGLTEIQARMLSDEMRGK